jgi:hypothetical protein
MRQQLGDQQNNHVVNSLLGEQMTNELDTKTKDLVNKYAVPEVQNVVRNVLGNLLQNGQSSKNQPDDVPANTFPTSGNPTNIPEDLTHVPLTPTGETPLYQSPPPAGKTLYP